MKVRLTVSFPQFLEPAFESIELFAELLVLIGAAQVHESVLAVRLHSNHRDVRRLLALPNDLEPLHARSPRAGHPHHQLRPEDARPLSDPVRPQDLPLERGALAHRDRAEHRVLPPRQEEMPHDAFQ